jgi:DNA-binding CsgD family transcriptional regulator
VETSARDGPLAGLVSKDAEELYAKLLKAGWLPIGPGADQIDLANGPARELTDSRVAYRSPMHADRLLPVAQSTAIQLLLSRQHDEMTARHQQAIAGWKLLDSILYAHVEPKNHSAEGGEFLAEVVTGRDELNRLSYELYQSTRRELLGLSTGKWAAPLEERQLLAPPKVASSLAGQYRMIYDTEMAGSTAGARIIEASVAAGEKARIRAQLPLKMLHVDDSVALVSLTPTGLEGSLLVRSPPMLAALREWFEFLWNDDATAAVGDADAIGLSPMQRHVLRMLSTSQSDEAIARAAGMSVRTVRRHIAAILEILGVNSRFAAGMMATKRGWL